jgi:ferredoxin--NADP+ reductase
VKRGPVGLIGHTKSDAAQTVAHLLATTSPTAPERDPARVDEHLAARGIDVQTFERWGRLDAFEMAQGEAEGRTRIKVPDREGMLRVSR